MQNLELETFPTAPSDWMFEGETVHLHRPPFRTLKSCCARSAGWAQLRDATPSDLGATLVIGDFGLGSDSLIFLDFGLTPAAPSVGRLTTTDGMLEIRTLVDSFDEFIERLELDRLDRVSRLAVV